MNCSSGKFDIKTVTRLTDFIFVPAVIQNHLHTMKTSKTYILTHSEKFTLCVPLIFTGYRVYKGVAGDSTSSSLFAEAMTASFSVVVKTSSVHILNAVFCTVKRENLDIHT